MACCKDLKTIIFDAAGELNHNDIFADIKVETKEIPISIKAEPDYDVKGQISDKVDTLFDIVHDQIVSDTKPDGLKIKGKLLEDSNESFECHPRLIKQEHKTWSEDSRSSSSVENHVIETDGAGPSSYELKSEAVDLGELKMEQDEENSKSFKVRGGRSGEKNSVRQHIRTHGGKYRRSFNCIICEKGFSSKQSLDRHIVRLHSNNCEMMKNVTHKIHRCKHCKYFTARTSDLTNHMRTHGEMFGNTFDCIKCEMKFSLKQSLDNHIVTTHSDDGEMMKSITNTFYSCEHCKYITVKKTSLIKHMRTHGKIFGITFDCIKCDKEFSSKLFLDNHIVRLHSDDCEMMKSVTCKILRCMHCQYFAVKKYALIIHMRTHGKKFGITFDCIKCKKEFSTKQRLDNHIAIMHSSDVKIMESITNKMYRCEHCKYVTAIKSNLTNHMRTHGEKLGNSFDCISCEKAFSKKQSFDNHIVTMHSNNVTMMKSVTSKIYRCEHCKYVTVIKSNLTKHIGTHGEKLGITFNCIKCEKAFSKKQSLDNHIVTIHNDDDAIMKSVTSKIHRCKCCKYFTIKKPSLTNHMRTHGESYL